VEAEFPYERRSKEQDQREEEENQLEFENEFQLFDQERQRYRDVRVHRDQPDSAEVVESSDLEHGVR